MIFDTNFVIDVMRADAEALEKLAELESKGEPQAVTAPTLFELYSGLARSTKPEAERKNILNTLAGLIVFHLDALSAERAGEEDGRLVKSGERIEPVDSMIAGISLTMGETLLTRNTKHFSRIDGLKLESY
jgi:hypothetical protein